MNNLAQIVVTTLLFTMETLMAVSQIWSSYLYHIQKNNIFFKTTSIFITDLWEFTDLWEVYLLLITYTTSKTSMYYRQFLRY